MVIKLQGHDKMFAMTKLMEFLCAHKYFFFIPNIFSFFFKLFRQTYGFIIRKLID